MVYFVTNREDYLNSYEVKFVRMEQIEDVLLENKVFCEDTETTGLDPFAENPLLLIQLGTRTDQFVFDIKSGIDLTTVKKILENRKVHKILVNGIFERHMIRSKEIRLNSMVDLSLAAQVLRQGRAPRMLIVNGDEYYIYSLAGLFKEYLDVDINKEQQSSFINHKGDKFSLEQILYAAEDVKLFELYEDIIRRLVDYDLINIDFDLSKSVEELVKEDKYYKAVLEFKVQEYFADMLYNGIYLDKEKWKKLFRDNKKKRYDTEVQLNTHLLKIDPTKKGWRIYPPKEEDVIQNSLFGTSEPVDSYKMKYLMNWGSSKQVMPVLKLELGYIPTDKKGKETISNKELKKLVDAGTSKFINDLYTYSTLNKAINAYGVDYFENIHPKTGRIHFQINQVLETGRIAPRKPNLAQIPSGKEWRDCFAAPKGCVMVGADYSAQESQTMADKSGDSNFIDFFLNGDGDSHSMVATRVYTAKEGRQVVISKKQLKVEHKGEIEGGLEEPYKRLFPKSDTVKYDTEFMILSSTAGLENPLRQQGKILNFFISFGGSAYTLSIDKKIPIKEAESLIDNFWKGFPELKMYFDSEKKFAIEKGYTIINKITKGRRWYPEWKEFRGYEKRKEEKLKELVKAHGEKEGKRLFFKGMKEKTLGLQVANSRSFKLKGDIERAAMNTGIQGTAADMTKTSCILLAEELEKRGLDLIGPIKPVNCVHDENLLQVDEKYAEEAKQLLKYCMEKASSIFLNTLIISASAYIANEWKH